MRKALRPLFKTKKNQRPEADGYLHVLAKGINLELKQKIFALEGLGEVVAEKLQRKYTDVFEGHGKRNLSIKICRDIDGDVISDLTAERCLEKEYRSQVTIHFRPVTANEDEDVDAFTIDLWYYYGGFIGSGCGTLFDLNNNDLEKEMVEALIFLLHDNISSFG
ncbi:MULTISPECIES: hypothetical protein [Bacillus]|uniref:hypothetical protein n=1 Tax=Bacillus TaxID=1386 RepID=UPI00057C0C98|nr:hypothetical protein [Bacillus sp. MSP13]